VGPSSYGIKEDEKEQRGRWAAYAPEAECLEVRLALGLDLLRPLLSLCDQSVQLCLDLPEAGRGKRRGKVRRSKRGKEGLRSGRSSRSSRPLGLLQTRQREGWVSEPRAGHHKARARRMADPFENPQPPSLYRLFAQRRAGNHLILSCGSQSARARDIFVRGLSVEESGFGPSPAFLW